MASPSTPYTFRRRTIGRAASPPTWACYEQIHDDEDDFSDSGSEESCSEDEADYARAAAGHESDSEDSDDVVTSDQQVDDVAHDMEMDVDAEGLGLGAGAGEEAASARNKALEAQKDVKGKQRAVEPEPEATKRRHRKKQRQQVYTLRPILTIHRSQGFVWNQDLFVPPYIKDRYVASTSPPNSISTSFSSTNSALTDYEVEVVEIRVQEGEFDGIIP
ncbi:hypothetical protein C8R44DRAFT_758089 [Mycena epipterygia]|nr:hypothetical protein C8R44DRAFT_758089 [Mycena epipterygia]